MKKVLVTGAGGFIGSNMVKFLLDNTDYFIYGIDNFINGDENKKFIEGLVNDRFKFIQDDFVNFNFIDNLVDIVYHFAAMPSVPFSVEQPLLTNENNVTKTLTLLKKCSESKIKKFIFSSTSAIYGDTETFPTSESDLINFKSPYALQKLIIEQYSKIWSELYDIETVCLRYFNVYGPNQYASNAYANVICAWIKGYVQNSEIRIDGDGTQIRSFVFVNDVCMANYLMGESIKKFKGEIFNVSARECYTLLKIKNLLDLISNNAPKIKWAPIRNGDVFKTHANISKIENYNFVPKYTIDEGLKITYNWYKKVLE